MEGGRGRRGFVKRSYLTVTSSVNLSTRCVRMLRGMVLPPSCLWGGLLFRHAGRVELYARAPPVRGGERAACKRRQRKTKMTCNWRKTSGGKISEGGGDTCVKLSRLLANVQGRWRSNIHIMTWWANRNYGSLLNFQFTVYMWEMCLLCGAGVPPHQITKWTHEMNCILSATSEWGIHYVRVERSSSSPGGLTPHTYCIWGDYM